MAEPIDYEAPLEQRATTATGLEPSKLESSKLEEIVYALRHGGADALAVMLERLDSNAGRAAVTRIAKLSLLTGSYTPLLVERLANGIAATSAKVASSEVPSWWELARQTRLPSTRRGIGVALALLRALGGEQF
ncbi:DUF1641 domain-containing protein [Ferrimicrobium sp.]|uniref:DUF1641 domain-containing protein n=1 Tax=Ferrimicrobium sp. TaxID=2926050 RepID=UPI0026259FC8|nr:DUF1641 domain-containing protein [Ferrimicrobium sp.]